MKSIFCFLLSFLLVVIADAQETKSSLPKVGRYIQQNKETTVGYFTGFPIKFQLTSVDVLNEKEMRINLIIENTTKQMQTIGLEKIPKNPLYIIDENFVKYQPISELKAEWNLVEPSRSFSYAARPSYYALAPTEAVKGEILFPILTKGARKFDLYIGYEAQPITDVQLIE